MANLSYRLLPALRDLALAMLNATLILIVLCLFLGLRLTDRLEDVRTELTSRLAVFAPLRADLQQMTGEIAGLRSDLSDLRQTGELAGTPAAQALNARIGALETRLEEISTGLGEIRTTVQAADIDAEALVAHAAGTAAVEFAAGLGALAGCSLPGTGPAPGGG